MAAAATSTVFAGLFSDNLDQPVPDIVKVNYAAVKHSGWRTFPILRQTASWMTDHLAVKPSAIGQLTWPTQPSIPQGLVNE